MADSDIAVATLPGPPGSQGYEAPFNTVQHSSQALSGRLGALEIPRAALARDLTVPSGARLDLTSESASALEPRRIETPSLRQYKGWIGRPDEAAEGLLADPGAEADLEAAGRLYLFGDSRLVAASDRSAIERERGPFRAAVYAARRVVVEPEAALVVSGDPAILLFEELVLRDGGQLVTYTATHATFGLLRKLESQGARALWH
ncbi:MAG: hypothetical protein AAF725_15810 [Acidobacteriota bacterium]